MENLLAFVPSINMRTKRKICISPPSWWRMTGLEGIQLLVGHRSGMPSCGLCWPPGPSPWTRLLTPALSLQDLLWGPEPGRRVLLAPSLEAWSGGFLKNCFTKSFIINKFHLPPLIQALQWQRETQHLLQWKYSVFAHPEFCKPS